MRNLHNQQAAAAELPQVLSPRAWWALEALRSVLSSRVPPQLDAGLRASEPKNRRISSTHSAKTSPIDHVDAGPQSTPHSDLLVSCPACKHEPISRLADDCPRCGQPLQPLVGDLPPQQAPNRDLLQVCPACAHRPIAKRAKACPACGCPILPRDARDNVEWLFRIFLPIASALIAALGLANAWNTKQESDARAEALKRRDEEKLVIDALRLFSDDSRGNHALAAALLKRAADQNSFPRELVDPLWVWIADEADPKIKTELIDVAKRLDPDALQRGLDLLAVKPELAGPLVAVGETRSDLPQEQQRDIEKLQQTVATEERPPVTPSIATASFDPAPSLIYWTHRFDINFDGPKGSKAEDPSWLPYTAMRHKDGQFIDSREVAFVTLPSSDRNHGVKLGDFVVVRDTVSSRVSYGIVGDWAPPDRPSISKKLAIDLGRDATRLAQRWRIGEITAQIFVGSGDGTVPPPETIAKRGEELRRRNWPPVFPHTAGPEQADVARSLAKALASAGFRVQPTKAIEVGLPETPEIRYFDEHDVASAWDVSQVLRGVEQSRFGSVKVRKIVGYATPPRQLEIFLNR